MASDSGRDSSVLDEIGSEHRGRSFAIIIDEAHSSQGGKTSAAVSMALSAAGAEEDDETLEDQINRIMEARKLLPNASYFAFGTIGPVVAAMMIVLGYLTVIEFARRGYDLSGDLQRAPLPPGIPPPTAEEFVAAILAPLLAFVNFGLLTAAGLWFRSRPEVHKRLMLLALVSLALTPLIHLSGNLVGRWPDLSVVLSIAVPLVFILVLFSGAVHDKLSRGRIHPISVCVPILLVVELFGINPIVMQSATWRQFAMWLVAE